MADNKLQAERNAEIYSKRCEGMTLRAIAELYGITTERVRQICSKERFAAISREWGHGLSREELKNALIELSKRTDIDEEKIHVLADGILCDALSNLGYYEAIEVYEQLPKWYS